MQPPDLSDDRVPPFVGGSQGSEVAPPASVRLSDAFAELGRIVLAEDPPDSVLNRIAELAKRVIPGAAETSLTLIHGRDATTAAYTGERALRLDEAQYAGDIGPCLEAARDGREVLVRDIAVEPRWPSYGVVAVAAGLRSSLSMPLPVQQQVIGALNIYGGAPGAFSEHSAEVARTYAGYAAIALANAQVFAATSALAQQMKQAMESRAVIEQAKGILMGQRRCSEDDAFAILRDVSQRSNRKLRVVAEALVAQDAAETLIRVASPLSTAAAALILHWSSPRPAPGKRCR